jgi:hypothetical protein
MGMASKLRDPCIGTVDTQVRKFLREFACRLTEVDAIEQEIRKVASVRGENCPWVAKWVAKEGPQWVNDMETLVFNVPLETLAGSRSLHFTQQVWMLQPTSFGYQVWGDRGFVRVWWDRSRSAFLGQIGRY